jgi:hypothetical protein
VNLLEGLDMPVHPYTGLIAIGMGKRGPIWPVAGGAKDDAGEDTNSDSDDDSESDDSDDDSGDDSSSKSTARDSGKSKKGTSKESDDDDERVYTAAEYNRVKARMQAADRRATETEKRLKALEDKDKPEDVKTKAELATALKELEDIRKVRQKDLIQLAFLRANEVEWHDPEDALTMADLSDVEIDDDGNVDRKALKAALRDLAKRKPHLVKQSKKDDEQDEEEEDESKDDQRSSGSKMAGNRKGSKGKGPSRDDLAKKFPALRRR